MKYTAEVVPFCTYIMYNCLKMDAGNTAVSTSGLDYHSIVRKQFWTETGLIDHSEAASAQ